MEFWLLLFVQDELTHDQGVHLGSHEAFVGVEGRPCDGFTPDVERSVHDQGAAGLLVKPVVMYMKIVYQAAGFKEY